MLPPQIFTRARNWPRLASAHSGRAHVGLCPIFLVKCMLHCCSFKWRHFRYRVSVSSNPILFGIGYRVSFWYRSNPRLNPTFSTAESWFSVNLNIVLCRKWQAHDQKMSTSAHWIRMNLVGTHGHFCTQWLHSIPTHQHQRSAQKWHRLWTFSPNFIPVNLVQRVCVKSKQHLFCFWF